MLVDTSTLSCWEDVDSPLCEAKASQQKGYPKSLDSWEPVDALRVDVRGLVSAYMQKHQVQTPG